MDPFETIIQYQARFITAYQAMPAHYSFAVLPQITAPIDLIAEYKLFSTNFNLENIIPPSREVHRTTMEAIDTICTVILRIVEKLESYNHDSGIVVFRVNI